MSEPMALQHGKRYLGGVDLSRYAVSEKLDGHRALWRGGALYTRNGHPLRAPAWFTAGWPMATLDGELWAGRGALHAVSSVVNTRGSEDGWRNLLFVAFDAPMHRGCFEQRLAYMHRLLRDNDADYLSLHAFVRVNDEAALMRALKKVVDGGGGEGLMLARWDARYEGGRNSNVLKVLP